VGSFFRLVGLSTFHIRSDGWLCGLTRCSPLTSVRSRSIGCPLETIAQTSRKKSVDLRSSSSPLLSPFTFASSHATVSISRLNLPYRRRAGRQQAAGVVLVVGGRGQWWIEPGVWGCRPATGGSPRPRPRDRSGLGLASPTSASSHSLERSSRCQCCPTPAPELWREDRRRSQDGVLVYGFCELVSVFSKRVLPDSHPNLCLVV
jgi:hypothetical protein